MEWVRDIDIYDACWWYSLCNFQYHTIKKTGSRCCSDPSLSILFLLGCLATTTNRTKTHAFTLSRFLPIAFQESTPTEALPVWNGAQTNVTKIDALTIGTKEIEAVRQRHQRLATSMEQKLDVGELGQGKETSSASVLKARGWEGMVLWPGKTMPNDGRVGEGRKKKRPDNERKSLGTSNIERVYGFRTVGIHNSVRWVQDDADDVMGTWSSSV
jgi:hypothetical protein